MGDDMNSSLSSDQFGGSGPASSGMSGSLTSTPGSMGAQSDASSPATMGDSF